MFRMMNNMITPKTLTNSLNYEELLRSLENEIKSSSETNLTLVRLNENVRGIDLQNGAEIIFIKAGATGAEILEELELEDGSDAKFSLNDSYYNNKLPKDENAIACFGDIIKVISEDSSESKSYVIMEDNSGKSISTQIEAKEMNSIIKEIDNINKVIKLVEPVNGLMASDLIEMIVAKDGSNQVYDVQGIEPIFDDALITKDNKLDLVTEEEKFVVISENRYNTTRYTLEFVK
ncbi:MAG: hypothetical protein Q4P31_02900 [Andreesenia angusta]|nr:hypothetical protein [Andreesenia angusta]